MPKNYCPKCGDRKRSEIISYDKGVKCSVCDWKAEKPKYQGTPPPSNKDSISITEILWRELKERCYEYGNFGNTTTKINPDIMWQEYQMKLIKESQE